jgi:hypothetical protein
VSLSRCHSGGLGADGQDVTRPKCAKIRLHQAGFP